MAQETVYLDAVLEPPKSLSQQGAQRVLWLLAAASAALAIGFLSIGAYPVTGFMGAELLLLWFAFRWTQKPRSARTYVRVTSQSLLVLRVDNRGREARARLPSSFARVEHDRQASGPGALRVSASGKSYAIGEHLNPEEQASFARCLQGALAAVRRERHDERDPA
jgi:uncharacterized membrane protein